MIMMMVMMTMTMMTMMLTMLELSLQGRGGPLPPRDGRRGVHPQQGRPPHRAVRRQDGSHRLGGHSARHHLGLGPCRVTRQRDLPRQDRQPGRLQDRGCR